MSDSKKTIKAMKISQPVGDFYIAKMKASFLKTVSGTDIAELKRGADDDVFGEQRRLIPKKVKQIKKYVKTSDATFPASIVLNLNERFLVSSDENEITFEINKGAFTIIDGQHRLFAFEDNGDVDFELPVSIFIGLKPSQKARIFQTVNSTQTAVNPSLNLYLELKETIWTPRKMVVEIAELFNNDRESPFYRAIKYNIPNENIDKDISNVSLQTFGQAILGLIYDDENDFYTIRDSLAKGDDIPLDEITNRKLWVFYYKKNEEALYKILNNYFSAVKDVFPRDWKSKESLLAKTTGYNALIFLFSDLYDIGIEKRELSYGFFLNKIEKAKQMEGTFNTEKFGPSGWYSSKMLYKKMLSFILPGLYKSKYPNETADDRVERYTNV